MRHLGEDIVPISIALKTPSWYHGLVFKQLAPNPKLLHDYKSDENFLRYSTIYKITVLDYLNAEAIYERLLDLSNGKEFALLCYEKDALNCHRGIVADWFNYYGYEMKEFKAC